jgi:opacity protein-like surface antigen
VKQIQKFLVASAALAAGVALSAGGAAAQGLFGGGGLGYVKGFGGATWPQNDNSELDVKGFGTIEPDSGLDFDTGYVLGIAAGYYIRPNVSAELEYTYRNADAELKNTNSDSHTTESNAWMANALYWFDPVAVGASSQLRPYAGGGLGAADFNFEQVDELGGGDFDGDYEFAYQLMAGVAYDVNEKFSITTEVRYFGISEQDLENDTFDFKNKYQTWDLLVGAVYRF